MLDLFLTIHLYNLHKINFHILHIHMVYILFLNILNILLNLLLLLFFLYLLFCHEIYHFFELHIENELLALLDLVRIRRHWCFTGAFLPPICVKNHKGMVLDGTMPLLLFGVDCNRWELKDYPQKNSEKALMTYS
jgi:hypothetical protein